MRVELFGIARLRAGTGLVELDLGACDLDSAVRALAAACPTLVPDVIADGRLSDSYVANLNGQAFLSDGATPIAKDDTLLILAAHAGG